MRFLLVVTLLAVGYGARTASEMRSLKATLEAAPKKVAAVIKNQKTTEKSKLDQLESISSHLEEMFAKTRESHKEELKTRKNLFKTADAKTKAQSDHWNEVFDHMYEKNRAFDHMIQSKIKNAIHLVKKGAMSGNKEAAEQLKKVVEGMGNLSGGSKIH